MINGIDDTTVTAVIDIDVQVSVAAVAKPFDFVPMNNTALLIVGGLNLNTAVIALNDSVIEPAQTIQFWS